MYDIIPLGISIDYCTIVIKKKREEYIIFYKDIEAFASKHNIIIGFPNYYLTQEVDHYDLYIDTEKCLDLAKQFVDETFQKHKDGMGYFTYIKASIGNMYIISIYNIPMVNFISLPHHRGIEIRKSLITSDIITPYKHKIITFGIELHLLATVMKLQNPTYESEWPQLIKDEQLLRAKWKDDRIKVKDVNGGYENDTYKKVHKIIFSEFLNGAGRVVVNNNNSERIQIICVNNLNDEVKIISDLLVQHLNVQIETTYNDPKIPIDPRLRKITLYLTKPKRIPFCDLFNMAQYEIVPYIPNDNGICIGTDIVTMRIFLIDYWIMTILFHMDVIKESYALSVCANLKNKYMKLNSDQQYPLTVIGQYENYALYIKRVSRNGQSYYPTGAIKNE